MKILFLPVLGGGGWRGSLQSFRALDLRAICFNQAFCLIYEEDRGRVGIFYTVLLVRSAALCKCQRPRH